MLNYSHIFHITSHQHCNAMMFIAYENNIFSAVDARKLIKAFKLDKF